MQKRQKQICGRWELAGTLVISLAGSLFHFVFGWSGGFRPLGALFAVNESTWEHLKLAFIPTLVFALVEYFSWKPRVPNFWCGKFLGMISAMGLIVGIFYAYTAILGSHYLEVDIALFIVAVGVGQFVSYLVITRPDFDPFIRHLAVVGVLLLLAAFVLFTYYPPRGFLWLDTRLGAYGIIESIGQ